MRVKLLTRDGGFVKEFEIPPFMIPPEILVWGSRSFVLQPSGEYREGMAYYCLEGTTCVEVH